MMSKAVLTMEKLLELAKPHKSTSSFIEEHLKYYVEAWEVGLISEFLLLKGWRDVIPWANIPRSFTERILLASIKSHTSIKNYKKLHISKCQKANEIGFWDKMLESKGWSKNIYWDDMSDNEIFEYVHKVAQTYNIIDVFEKRAPFIYEKCIELGCLNKAIQHMAGRVKKLEDMTREDALSYCYRIAKESPSFKSFRQKNAYKYLMNTVGKVGVEKACSHFGYKFPKLAKEIDLRSDALKRAPEDISSIKTIADTVAYLVSRMDDETYFEFREDTTYEFHKNIFKLTQCELHKADFSWLKCIINGYAKYNQTVRGFNKYIIKPAIKLGIPIRIRIQLNKEDEAQGLFKIIIQNLLPISCNPYHPETVIEMIARILEKKNGKIMYQNTIYEFANEFGHIPLNEFTYEKLKEWKSDNLVLSSKKICSHIRMALLNTAIEKGLLDRDFYGEEHPFYKEVDKYLINKNLLPKEEWTVFWYLLQVKEKYLEVIKTSISKRNQLRQGFFVLGNIKPFELTKEIYEAMPAKKAVIATMIRDGVYNPSAIIEEGCNYNIKDDTWQYNKSILNFNIVTIEWFREALKVYYDKFYLNRTTAQEPMSRIYEARFLEDFLLQDGVKSLKEFTNETKQRLYFYLDTLLDQRKYSRVKRIITFCRSFFSEIKKIEPSLVDPYLVFKPNEFIIPKKPKPSITPVFSELDMKVFIDYINKEKPEQKSSERLIDIAVAIQVLLFRRVSETVTLEVDCLRKLGNSGELALSYYSIKKQRNEFVSFSILKGDRKDPFADTMEEMVPRLIKEAINITSQYRKIASENTKKIFLLPTHKVKKYGLVKCFGTDRVTARLRELVSELGLTNGILSHGARDTAATKLIRSGSTIAEVAAALGDEIETVQKSYINTVVEHETMILSRGKLLTNIKDDISEIVLTKYAGEPQVITDQEANSKNYQDVVGGKCSVEVNEMFRCPSFLMTSGNRGCKGCSMHCPTPSNLPYWTSQLQASSNRLNQYRGTQFKDHLLYDYQRNENIVNRLRELSNEYS